MIAAWMLVSALLGIVIALGALALEVVCRTARIPVRWTWAGSLGLLVLLTLLAPVRRMPGGETVHVTLAAPGSSTRVERVAPSGPLVERAVAAVRSMLEGPVEQVARAVARSVPPVVDRWLGLVWIACSLVLLTLAVLVFRRLHRARRTWPTSSLHGERVHVAPDAGPAVFGILRGAIVVPPWLTECASDVQEVVVAHEREHVRARDPMLLALGAAAVILLPWNPAAWWMLARLRLAVELDCDRRVLDTGVRTRDYGMLLIDLAGRARGTPFGAPLVGLTMLAERTTHLERRIVAMSASRPRHTAVRIAAGSLIALVAALAACEAKMPTSVDVDNMTAASATRAATTIGLLNAKDSITVGAYYVDGRSVSAAEARAIPPEKIATILVVGDRADKTKGTVHITTRDAASRAGEGGTYTITARKVDISAPHDSMRFAGLVFIDGKRSDQNGLKSLSPADIASIEVIKGARAAELYPNEPTAAQGVIQVTTKHAAH